MVKILSLFLLSLLVSCFDAPVIPKNKDILQKIDDPVVSGNAIPSGFFSLPVSNLTISQGTTFPVSFKGEDPDNVVTLSVYAQSLFNTNCSSGTLLSIGLAEGNHLDYMIDSSLMPLGTNFICFSMNDGVNAVVDIWSPQINVINPSLYTFLTPNAAEFSYANNSTMQISWSDTDHALSTLELDIYLASVSSGSCSQGIKITGDILESSTNNTYTWNIKNQNISPGIYYLCLRRSDEKNVEVDVWSTPIIITAPVFRPVSTTDFTSGPGTIVPGLYGNSGSWNSSLTTPGQTIGTVALSTNFSVEFLLKFPENGHAALNSDYSRSAAVKNVELFRSSGLVANFGVSGLSFTLNYSSGSPSTVALNLQGAGINRYDHFLDNNWHHVVFTRNASTGKGKIFVDGKSNDQMEFTLPGTALAGGVTTIGSLQGNFFIDEFRLYTDDLPFSLVSSHYAEFQSANPFSITDPGNAPDVYEVNIAGAIDPKDFAIGHPYYTQSTYYQLSHFPRPQYKRGHNLLRNSSGLMPLDFIINDSINQSDNNSLTPDEKGVRFQKELVEFNNYALVTWGVGHTKEATPNLSSSYINLRTDVPLVDMVAFIAYGPEPKGNAANFLEQKSAWDSAYKLTNTSNNSLIDYSGVIVNPGNVVINPYVFSPTFTGPAPSVAFGPVAKLQALKLDTKLDTAMITRPINMIFENGEYLEEYVGRGLQSGYLLDSTVVQDFIDRYTNGVTPYFIPACNTGIPQTYDLTYFSTGATNKLKITPTSYSGQKACELNALWDYYSAELVMQLYNVFKEGYLNYDYINNRHPWSPTYNDPLNLSYIGGSTNSSVQLREAIDWDGIDMGYTAYYQYKTMGAQEPTYHNYAKVREVLTTIKGQKYPTDMAYILSPSHWNKGMVSAFSFGFGHFWDSRVIEVKWGDHHAAPAVSPGWNGNNSGTNNILPSQWLSILKFQNILGAEHFWASNFQHDQKDPNRGALITPQNYVWQMATPALAQSLVSHYEDIFANGYFLTNTEWKIKGVAIAESDKYKIEILKGNFLTPVYVRKHMSQDRFVIATGIMRSSNIKDTVPEEEEIRIKLSYIGGSAWEETFTVKTRRQGSVYLFDRTTPLSPVFYQLDKWHESNHYSHWSDDIKLEAEMHDSMEVGQTSVKVTETNDPEYAEYVTFMENLTTNKKVSMHFDNKFASGLFYVWAKVRSATGSNLVINVSRMNRAVVPEVPVAVTGLGPTAVGSTGVDFEWLLVGSVSLVDRTQILLDVKNSSAGDIDLDQLFITADGLLTPTH